MARGWESKSVEAQIEEGNQSEPESVPKAHSAQSRMLQEKMESLRMSRSRLLQQLENARHPAHRDVLMKGLQAIEKQLEETAADL